MTKNQFTILVNVSRPDIEHQLQQLQMPVTSHQQQTPGLSNATNSNMNVCYVSLGTYNICSKTYGVSGLQASENLVLFKYRVDVAKSMQYGSYRLVGC